MAQGKPPVSHPSSLIQPDPGWRDLEYRGYLVCSLASSPPHHPFRSVCLSVSVSASLSLSSPVHCRAGRGISVPLGSSLGWRQLAFDAIELAGIFLEEHEWVFPEIHDELWFDLFCPTLQWFKPHSLADRSPLLEVNHLGRVTARVSKLPSSVSTWGTETPSSLPNQTTRSCFLLPSLPLFSLCSNRCWMGTSKSTP